MSTVASNARLTCCLQTEEHQFKFRLSLASVKGIHVKDPYPRFMKLTFLDGTQYSIAFQNNTELEGWYKDINQICTLPSPSNYEEGDILEIIDGYFVSVFGPIPLSTRITSPCRLIMSRLQLNVRPRPILLEANCLAFR